MSSFNLFSDFVPEPVPGYESVTNKLMNVVVTIENLTPGLTIFRNFHSGNMFSLQSRLRGPYGLQSHRGDYVLIGTDDVRGKIGLRVNMGYDMLRRIEFASPKHHSWETYFVDGYVELLIPRSLVERMFLNRTSFAS